MTSGSLDVSDTNMAAPLLARSFGEIMFAMISAIAFTTVLGTVSGLIVAASGAVVHDLLLGFFNIPMKDETKVKEEVIEVMKRLRSSSVDILTIGQYLQPTGKQLPVLRFVTPEEFKFYEEVGNSLGFSHVESGPLVRSSYHAEKHIV